MANNRMYLKCSLCGEEFYLAKYYPSTGWYLSTAKSPNHEKETFGEVFAEFLDKHSPCPRRDEQGLYLPDAPNVVHGKPTPDENLFGKVFTLRYE